jgi:hypothetical protein
MRLWVRLKHLAFPAPSLLSRATDAITRALVVPRECEVVSVAVMGCLTFVGVVPDKRGEAERDPGSITTVVSGEESCRHNAA